MDGNFFFVVGIVLVLAAVGLAFVGIRGSESFPPGRGVMAGVIGLFAAIVATTMAFAIVKANDEQKDRNDKLAKEEAQAAGTTTTAGGGAAQTLAVSTPATAGLTFQPDGLTAKPGNVTITYDNAQTTPHSIAVATSNGNVLGQVQPFANGKQSLTLNNLAPGKYVFYCTVPGHREAGMQGDLTVLGGK
jgi:plastocyanin